MPTKKMALVHQSQRWALEGKDEKRASYSDKEKDLRKQRRLFDFGEK